ncbi:hypothetical protein EIP86_009679 [Pleurotus ostreatoroseus]|nr:hypothetical protein EIP86_009679 [Pleurotus ostreatoroseus]
MASRSQNSTVKSQGSELKQKSLMAFFGKAKATASNATKSASNAKSKPEEVNEGHMKPSHSRSCSQADLTSDPPALPETPPKKGSQSSAVGSATYTHTSNGISSGRDTPPTSDPIDVDMMSMAEDEEDNDPLPKAQQPLSRGKRKAVIEDSDEDFFATKTVRSKTATSENKSLVRARGCYDRDVFEISSTNAAHIGRSKKPRISTRLSDEDVLQNEDKGDSEDDAAVASFSKRLTKFQPAVKKHKRRNSGIDDDDDFIVPDDEDEEDEDIPTSRAPSKSSRASSRSRLSDYAMGSTSELDADAVESDGGLGQKKSTGKRPTLGKHDSSQGSSSNLFLTKAELRTQKQKEEKKSTEEPFSFLVDVRDKDGVRPGEPGYDPRTLYIPSKAWKVFTPFEKQFWEIKQNHFDTVLFFQKGKFLELYEDDARIGHQEFDLKLTSRVKMSMVGVPEQNFNFWAAKFLAKGYKVGRVDQAETALGAEMRVAADKDKGKGKLSAGDKASDKIVRRVLNKVYTNGTLVDEALLTDDQAGHCVSIREDGEEDPKSGMQKFGICVLDSSTSEFNLSAFEDDICRTKLETLMRQLEPKELIFTKGNLSVSTSRLLKAVLPGQCLWTSLRESEGLSYEKTIKELKELYPSEADEDVTDNAFGLSSSVPEAIRSMLMFHGAVEALGSMIWYLRTLNIDKDILSMKNFNIYDPIKRGEGLVLDGQTLAHIEVLVNSEGTDDGTLLKLLGRCITPSGKRLFRIWLCMPLREIADINARLDAVQDLIDHPTFESEFSDVAKGLPDLERIVSRIHAKNCRVKDFLKVLEAFKKLSKGLSALADTSEHFKSKTILGLLRSAPDLSPHLKHVKAMFKPPEQNDDELVPQDGKDEIYDTISEEIGGLEEELNEKLKEYEDQLRLSWWHSPNGTKEIYLVQTKADQKNIPKDWVKSAATKAVKRWLVPELSSTIRSLKEAREHRKSAVKDFRGRLYAEFDADRSVWLRAIRVLSELDCLFTLAKASNALGEPVCRPEFVPGDSAWFEFEALRHPALSISAGFRGDFIPNDVKLGGDVGRIALLTGPNMGGKSTAMRMTAAGVIMAQLGMFVPARKARICPVDKILTRMGAYDNMFSNASTFKVELDEWYIECISM